MDKYCLDNDRKIVLQTEWDYERNNRILLHDYEGAISNKVWWKCSKCDGEWEARITHRIHGTNCPYCAGQKVLSGFNDLATIDPELAKEWDYEKNKTTPNTINQGSNKKVWWKCSNCGKEWEASVAARRRKGVLCADCKRPNTIRKMKETKNKHGLNSFALIYPKLLKEWDYERNGIDPETVTKSNGNKYWWKCSKCGGEWLSTVAHRTKDNRGCPYCAGQKVLSGFNDLATKDPKLAKEWNYEKNDNKLPSQFTCGTDSVVWWKCDKGHEWKARISNRYYLHNGCPICNKGYQISDGESIIYYYVKQYFCDAVQSFREKWLKKQEIDIYIPSIKLGIEYDGERWHKDINKDIQKTNLVFENGVFLIRLREKNCPVLIDKSYIIQTNVSNSNYETELDKPLTQLFSFINEKYKLNIKPNINVKRDKNKIIAMKQKYYNEQSLEVKYPDISKEWDYEKNNGLKPSQVLPKSNKKVWWRCDKGHEWETTINSRTRGTGCPYCTNKKVLSGFNDLKTLFPCLSEEWNYEKNYILPDKINARSNEKVWWKCSKCGGEWRTNLSQRTSQKTGCPYCSGHKVLKGVNDFKTKYPDKAKEWDYEKNEIGPDDITAHTGKKYWWKCSKCGGEWKTSPNERSRSIYTCCPSCSRKIAKLQSFN